MQTVVSKLVLAALLAAPAAAARANDSVAELGAGGIVLSRSDVIAMEKEDLYVSMDRIEVDYVFRNPSDEDVHAIVAFPMPALDGNPWTMPAIPVDQEDNFLGFEATIDGDPVKPALEQRAIAVGLDVTEELEAAGVPLYPFGDAAKEALAGLDEATIADWRDRGIIVIDEYDAGQGWQRVPTPYWTLRSTYWWRTVFPAGRTVSVWHRYKPAVGGSVGFGFLDDGKFQGAGYADYKAKYCIDESFERALLRVTKAAGSDVPPVMEERIAYVLTTGGNWAGGTIGRFTLTVDKGDPKNLVSFCGEGVNKIGPTTFRMTKEEFYPDRDLDILIVTRPAGGN